MSPRASETAPGWTGATGAPTTIVLARHGQTPLSVERRYSGRADAQLTELGRAQAAATADQLAVTPPDVVYSSPLSRCRATADLLAARLGVETVVEPGLVETDFGRWEGLTFREAARQDPEVHRAWLGDTSVRPPDGESFDGVAGRVGAALDRIRTAHAGRRVVVVSHVTPIKTALRLALDVGPQLLYRMHLDLASISETRWYGDGNASVHLVNSTAHLD